MRWARGRKVERSKLREVGVYGSRRITANVEESGGYGSVTEKGRWIWICELKGAGVECGSPVN